MGKGLGFLWWQADAVEDLFCGLKLGDKGEDFDFGATQGTQQGVDLVDFLEHFGPAEPTLPVPRCLLLGFNVWRGRSRASKLGIVQALAAGGVGIKAPVTDELLSRFGDMVGDPGDKLENIPSL